MPRVIIFGAGHVGIALAELLCLLECEVVVLDDRPGREAFCPAGARFETVDYADIGRKIMPDHRDYVVVMTAGHRSDGEVLLQVLPAEPAYVGCMGSRRKSARLREELAAAGFPKEMCDRLHAPIGLDIGAVTPKEIAVSVAAELIAELRRGSEK